jgi:hypothetical protein
MTAAGSPLYSAGGYLNPSSNYLVNDVKVDEFCFRWIGVEYSVEQNFLITGGERNGNFESECRRLGRSGTADTYHV